MNQMDHQELADNAMKALQKDIDFWKEVPLGARPIFEELVAAIPDVLGDDLLNSPANVAGIARAKVKVIDHALETDFASKMLEAMGMDSEMIEMIEHAMNSMAGMLNSLLEQSLEMLKKVGGSEERVLAKMGLNEELIEKCLRGGLTVGELFRDHPAIIIQNT
jgi:hypothetical protein